MNATVWIKVAAKKQYGRLQPGTVHAFKTKPATRENEVVVRINLEIPDAVFEDPVFEAKVVLPETVKSFPEKIEIAQQLGQALSEKMGFIVKVDMGEEPVEQS